MENKFNNILQTTEFREEFFVAQCQARLAEMLENKGLSRAELARKLGVSRARVTQIFSDEATNFTLRLFARSFLALDEEPVVITRNEYERLCSKIEPAHSQGDRRQPQSGDALSATLIAELLRGTNLEVEQERPSRRQANAKEWAQVGSNVVPFGRSAHA